MTATLLLETFVLCVERRFSVVGGNKYDCECKEDIVIQIHAQLTFTKDTASQSAQALAGGWCPLVADVCWIPCPDLDPLSNRGSGGKNVIHSNGPSSTSESSNYTNRCQCAILKVS
jgi:hypothetical protein